MYSIEFREQARKDLRRLPLKHMNQIQEKIDSLIETPRPQGCEKIETMPGYLRIRSGDYRILFEVNDKEKLVIIARIRQRSEAYR